MYYCFLRVIGIRFRAFKSRDSVGPKCSVFKCSNNLINCYLQESHMLSSGVGVPRCILELESPLFEAINPIAGLIWSKDGSRIDSWLRKCRQQKLWNLFEKCVQIIHAQAFGDSKSIVNWPNRLSCLAEGQAIRVDLDAFSSAAKRSKESQAEATKSNPEQKDQKEGQSQSKFNRNNS